MQSLWLVWRRSWEGFFYWLQTHIEKGNDLLEEASMLAQSGSFNEATGYKELARTLKKHLQSFTSKLEDTREQIERTAKCYQLLDKVSVRMENVLFYYRRVTKRHMFTSIRKSLKIVFHYIFINMDISMCM
jgi:hypothetical protein